LSRRRHTLRLDHPHRFRSVRVKGLALPALVTGTVRARTGATLAVAVNGSVAGVTRAYAGRDGTVISALVDPRAFRMGSNDVAVYGVAVREPPLDRRQRAGK